jgi:DNA-binding NtrC family response regulator
MIQAPSSAPPGHGTILVADDHADVLQALNLLLRTSGYRVLTARSVPEILDCLARNDVDVALLDLNYTRDTTSGGEGVDLVRKILALEPHLPLIVMTAWASVEGAVAALRAGARDYITKPWDNDRLLSTLGTHVELARALRRTDRLQRESDRRRRADLPDLFASSSPVMKKVLSLLERVARSDAHVLIRGDHGTGKEVVARWLHAVSPRSSKPFVAVNAGALSDGVFESELFGHVRGAFTDAKTDRIGCFELADEGVLFLDEIGTMPLGQQSKLLRVLQTGEFQPVGTSKLRHADVRVLSATNADLQRRATAGQFREDLLYRLNTVDVVLPPLCERREDIPLLARQFLAVQSARYGKNVTGFTAAAERALLAHAWPGNVRELEHAIERAVLLARADEIDEDDLALTMSVASRLPMDDMTLEQAEQYLIERALDRCAGDGDEAARRLGLSRSAFYRRLQRLRRGG